MNISVMPKKTDTSLRYLQRGASLIMVLMILIVVSILGIGGAQIALMGEKSSRNDTAYQMAWQAAEAALMDAEYEIFSGKRKDVFAAGNLLAFVDGCGAHQTDSAGLCLASSDPLKPAWAVADFDSSAGPYAEFGDFTSRPFVSGSTGIQPIQKPRYVIEILPDPNADGALTQKKFIYRITSMGFGPRADIQAVMQMSVKKE